MITDQGLAKISTDLFIIKQIHFYMLQIFEISKQKLGFFFFFNSPLCSFDISISRVFSSRLKEVNQSCLSLRHPKLPGFLSPFFLIENKTQNMWMFYYQTLDQCSQKPLLNPFELLPGATKRELYRTYIHLFCWQTILFLLNMDDDQFIQRLLLLSLFSCV